MKRFQRLAMAACGLGVASALIGSGMASADPAGDVHQYDRPIQGVGSDTTDDVMTGLSEVITDGTNKLMASWNATGGAFQTRSTGCNYSSNVGTSGYALGKRPNGSGDGVHALVDATTTGNAYNGCLDFARSSGSSNSSDNGTLTYIPFAKDAVGFAVTATSNLPRKLTFAQLKAMYNCTYPGFTGTTPTNHALIPQSGSGTRKFWLGAMGLTEAAIAGGTAYPCISDEVDRSGLGTGGPYIQEHRGNVLDDNTIVPISVAQFIGQSQAATADFRGNAVLGTVVDGPTSSGQVVSYPVTLNPSYGTVSAGTPTLNAPLTRNVYNVVPTKTITNGDPAFNQTAKDVFVGSGSKICQLPEMIQKYGFGTLATCGDTSLTH